MGRLQLSAPWLSAPGRKVRLNTLRHRERAAARRRREQDLDAAEEARLRELVLRQPPNEGQL